MNHEAYILQNHAFLTVQQMADELSLSDNRLRDLCTELGVVAISPKQQGLNYILEHHERKSAKEMSKTLGVGESTVLGYFRELGLQKQRGRPKGSLNKKEPLPEITAPVEQIPIKAFIKQPGALSVGDILGGYQAPGASHWMEDSIDRYAKIRYKDAKTEDDERL
jgi:hypothetical protein